MGFDAVTNDMVPCSPVPLYTLTVPEGTEEVTLSFSDKVLAYNYSSDGKTCLSAGYDNTVLDAGITEAKVKVDYNSDGELDIIQVQTPYDEAYNSTTYFAITFRYPAPFTASVGGTELTDITVTKDGYTPYDYDPETWEPDTVFDSAAILFED